MTLVQVYWRGKINQLLQATRGFLASLSLFTSRRFAALLLENPWHPGYALIGLFSIHNLLIYACALSKFIHVIGFFDLIDLWIIKIKSLGSFARVVNCQDQVLNSTEHETQDTWQTHVKGLFIL